MNAPEHRHAMDGSVDAREREDGWLGPIFRKLPRGRSGLCEDGDRTYVQILGSVRSRFADGFANGELTACVAETEAVAVAKVGLGLAHDLGHHLHGFHRILARSGFR